MSYDIVDMKRAENFTGPDYPEPSPYPYGLRIQLQQEDLDKLGITDMPKVGDQLCFYVCGPVCHTAESDDGSRCVGVQIQQMSVEEPPAAEEEERKDAIKGGFKRAAKTLYKNQE